MAHLLAGQQGKSNAYSNVCKTTDTRESLLTPKKRKVNKT